MEYKDYYKTLAVSKSATQEEIKKAYKKMAFRYHPDQNQGDKKAEEKFKEVNEANEVLSNPENRQKYDTLGANWKQYEQGGRGGGAGGFGGEFNGDLSDLFAGGTGSFFESFFGGGRGNAAGRRAASRKGRDYESNAEISLQEAYTGVKLTLSLNGKRLNFQVKPGVKDGQKLRIPGKGGAGLMGGPSGDLLVKVHVKPHAQYERKGNDLHATVPMDLYTAILGGKTVIPTMKGPKNVSIPAGSQPGKVLKLKGLGMPDQKRKDHFGNLLVTTQITLPQNLSPEEIQLFEQLRGMR